MKTRIDLGFPRCLSHLKTISLAGKDGEAVQEQVKVEFGAKKGFSQLRRFQLQLFWLSLVAILPWVAPFLSKSQNCVELL